MNDNYFVEIELVGKDEYKHDIEQGGEITDDNARSIENDINNDNLQKRKLTKYEKTKKWCIDHSLLTKTIIPIVVVMVTIALTVSIMMFFFAGKL
jgi:hypothetical protein